MKEKNCSSQSFKSLMVTQFLGAFNDNAFKIIISLMAIRLLPSGPQGTQFVSIIGALFIIPFIIFSPYAGFCADRFAKRNIIVGAKIAEIIIMVLGLIALVSGNLIFLCVVLFLMATQSAFFSPAKYGILPEMVDDSELSRGNGYLQMWTFLAIILGTAAGGRMLAAFTGRVWYSSYIIIFLSLIGFIVSLNIVKGIPAAPNMKFKINLFKEAGSALKEIKGDRELFLTLWALVYFWFMGAVFQMNILLYGTNIFKLNDLDTSMLLVFLSVGIACGGVLAGKLSEGKVELGLVPMGAIGFSVFSINLGLIPSSYKWAVVSLFLLGVSAGAYTVPLNAFFQQRSPVAKRGKYLAAMNILTSSAVLLGALFLWVFGGKLALNSAQIFFVLGILSIFATLYILITLPEVFVRMINWIIVHTFYRLKIIGSDNVPGNGGALIVCNHVSYVDAIIAVASLKRPVRFLMDRSVYNLPVIHFFCRIMKVIPISFRDGPKKIMESLHQARSAIEAGQLICIFPEGGLTRTGNMIPFNKGFEHIMKGLDAPIIPMNLDNIWGSIFSFAEGKYFFKMPRKIPYPVGVSFGKPMPSNSKVHEVKLAVQELGSQACKLRGLNRKKLHISFIEEAKKHPFRFCMADSMGMKFNYIKVLTAVIIMNKKLFPPHRRPKETNEMVGVLLPSSCMGSIANGAVLFAGKVPVNLNFTLSKESLDASICQCSMNTIITSRKFLEKLNIHARDEMVFLEDLKSSISTMKRLKTLAAVLLLPSSLIKRWFVKGDKTNVDDVATVIFSSGSTGEPKGIMLTHGNIFSNIEGFYQVFNIKPRDVVMGALPFFHSFGFTATLCFPVGVGVGVVYHSNPMDAAIIGKLVKKYKATMLMGTPTFLAAYLRRCTAEQFKTIRYVIAGAEKLKKQLTEAFYEKYGVIPFEGYGATELSPIVSVGFPDYVDTKRHIKQIGHKIGKVGHPIPGVAVKTVDPDTFELKPYNEEGLLLVKGPNVMKGYLNNPQKTAEVIKDGWYITGDMAVIDEDGFVHITDRLSRFSKIGGEMVPHIKVEEKIQEILGATELICAVTSVRDEKKGERLVVLYTEDIDVDWLWQALNGKGLPNLWIPRKDSFYRVEKIPVLGTGKLDLKGIKLMADRSTRESQ